MKRYRISIYSATHTLLAVMRVTGRSVERAIHAAYVRADGDGAFFNEIADYAIDRDGKTYLFADRDYSAAYSIINMGD